MTDKAESFFKEFDQSGMNFFGFMKLNMARYRDCINEILAMRYRGIDLKPKRKSMSFACRAKDMDVQFKENYNKFFN